MSSTSSRSLPRHAEIDVDTINAVIEEGGKFASEVLAPLNAIGDDEGCTLDKATHEVKPPTGFKEAYAQYVDGGWPALSCDPAFGGQGLPHIVNQCMFEMMNSANQAWTMYPGLSHGAYECLHTHGTDEQKKLYLPQAHQRPLDRHDVPDRAAVRHRPRPAAHQGRAAGRRQLPAHRQQDLHLRRRARPDREHRPPGAGAPARRAGGLARASRCSWCRSARSKADGSLGERNGIWCGGLEHKMGIHGNATAQIVLDDAEGTLVGEPNKGLPAMFVMMNAARLGVGMQGSA